MEFIHSVLKQNESVSASDVKTDDLPVNPLSFILLTLKFAQNLANTQALLANILAMIDKIEVLYKGSSEFTMNGSDAFASALYLTGFETWGVNAKGDDNELRSFTWCIPFGRSLWSPLEAYPASRRGELQLQTTFASSFTNIDGVTYQVETVEMPEANPERFIRQTTLSKTPAATGDNEVDLPIGNRISDIILWGTTIPSGATATRTITDVRLQINNQERYYSKTNFESLHNMAGAFRAPPGYWGSHLHQLDGAAYAQYMDSAVVKADNHALANYLYMPLDADRSGNFALQTQGLSDLELVINAGDTNPLRVIPVEIVEASNRRP